MGALSWIKKKLHKDKTPEIPTFGNFVNNDLYEPDTEHHGYNPMFEGGYEGPKIEDESPVYSVPDPNPVMDAKESPAQQTAEPQGQTIDTDVLEKEATEDDEISEPQGGKAITHYQSILDMLDSSSKSSVLGADSAGYTALKDSLTEVIASLDNTVNTSNFTEQYTYISGTYANAIEKYTSYLDSHKKARTSGGKARVAIATTMLALLKKDFVGIADSRTMLKSDSSMTWLDIINHARAVHIDASNAKVTKKGNAGRERYDVKIDGKSYFFTEKTGVYTASQAADIAAKDSDPKYAELFRRLIATSYEDTEHQSQFVTFFQEDDRKGFQDKLDDPAMCKKITKAMLSLDHATGYDDGEMIRGKEFIDLAKKIASKINKENPEANLTVDTDSDEFCKAFCTFCSSMMAVHKKGQDAIGAYEGKVGRNLSKRNVAMSRMADLLGMPSIVARSVNATVEYDGKTMEGNLMEGAIGMDHMNNPDMDDTSKMTFKSPKLQKQATQLQLLDTVCGQLDRHINNMFYDFDIDAATQKLSELKGIQGIDNDGAFGKLTDISRGAGKLDAIGIKRNKDDKAEKFSLPLVDKTAAERIKNLDKESLTMVLCDLIPQEDIDTTWERVTQLKQYLKELEGCKRKNGKSRFVEDGEWDDATADELLYSDEEWGEEVKRGGWYTAKNKDKKTGQDRIYNKTYYGRIVQGIGQQLTTEGGFYGFL